jgi:hypothetical protein
MDDKDWKKIEKQVKKLEKLSRGILNIVIKNWDYFKARPKHLAWAMMNYDLAHTAGRHVCEYTDNPKYPVLDAGEEHLSEEDADFLYDAWANCISEPYSFLDEGLHPKYKKNMTMDEWISYKRDPNYEYAGLYPSNDSVINQVLAVGGTGYGWNEDGFISKFSMSGIDSVVFAGYTRARIRGYLRSSILKLSDHKLIKKHVDYILSRVKINTSNNHAKKEFLRRKGQLSYDANKLIKGGKLSEDEYQKILDAMEYIHYYECLLSTARKWTREQWAEARKSDTYKVYDRELYIPEIRSDFYTMALFMETILISLKVDELGKKSKLSSLLRSTDSASDYRIDPLGISNPIIDDKRRMVKGWAAVKRVVDNKKKHRKELNEKLANHKPKRSKWYPLGDSCKLSSMPDNAHDSYVKAGAYLARQVIADPLSEKRSAKYAKKFLKKFNKRIEEQDEQG